MCLQSLDSRDSKLHLLPRGRVGGVDLDSRRDEVSRCNLLFDPGHHKLCGGKGIRVTRVEQLKTALKEAIAHQGPALVEIMTDGELI